MGTKATVSAKTLQTNQPSEDKSKDIDLPGDKVLFNVGSEGSVFVGGVPSGSNDLVKCMSVLTEHISSSVTGWLQVPSSVQRDRFQGCIDHIKVNSQLMPFFAFKETNVVEKKVLANCSETRFALERENMCR